MLISVYTLRIMTDVETPIKSLISTNMEDNTGTLIGQCLIPRGRGCILIVFTYEPRHVISNKVAFLQM